MFTDTSSWWRLFKEVFDKSRLVSVCLHGGDKLVRFKDTEYRLITASTQNQHMPLSTVSPCGHELYRHRETAGAGCGGWSCSFSQHWLRNTLGCLHIVSVGSFVALRSFLNHSIHFWHNSYDLELLKSHTLIMHFHSTTHQRVHLWRIQPRHWHNHQGGDIVCTLSLTAGGKSALCPQNVLGASQQNRVVSFS